MADHYEAAMNYRAIAIETTTKLAQLHDTDAGDERTVRRLIGHNYDKMRSALKLAQIDALLYIGQGLRDVVNAIEARQ